MFLQPTKPTKLCITLLAMLFVSTIALAKKSDKDAAVNIWADTFVADKKNNLATYQGNVKFEQGSIKIQCDTLEIIYQGDKIERFIMYSENVSRFEQMNDNNQLTVAAAQKMNYEQKSDLIVFSGKAELKQGKNVFKADSMLFNTVENRLISNKATNETRQEGSNRVFISIEPEKK